MQALARVQMRKTIFVATAALWLLCAIPALGATPAGTVIVNRAEATYTWQMQTHTVSSNWVSVSVLPVAGVQVTPKSTGHPGDAGFAPVSYVQAVPGQQMYLPYRLVNTGNFTDTFDITGAARWDAGAPALGATVVYLDENENGKPDPGEPAIQNITLDAGESAALLAAVRMPQTALDASAYFVSLQAKSQMDPAVTETETWAHLEVLLHAVQLNVQRSVTVDPLPAFPGIGGPGNIVAGTGARLTHTITIDNLGINRVDGAVLHEPLSTNEMLLNDTYGPDKALRFKAVPVSVDPLVDPWATIVTNASGNEAIQLVIDTLEPHQRAVLTYVTEVAWLSGHTQMEKSASLSYERAPGVAAQTVSNDIIVAKEGTFAVRLRPTGAELPPFQQGLDVRSQVYLGEKVPFPVTVVNTGELPGVVNLQLAGTVPAGWTAEWFAGDGATPLIDTNGDGSVDIGVLVSGASADVIVVVTVPTDEAQTAHAPYTFEIIGQFAENPAAADSTLGRIETVSRLDSLWQPLSLTAKEGPGVLPGQNVTYALLFGNDTAIDVYDVTITASLSDYLTDITPVHGDLGATAWIEDEINRDVGKTYESLGLTVVPGTYNAADHTITWHIPHVGPGIGGKLVFSGNVIGSAGGGLVIDVQGNMTSGAPDHTAHTPMARLTVLGEALTAHISSRAPIVAAGDANTYTVLATNVNPQQDFTHVTVPVQLPNGLTYRPGTARINGRLAADPVINGNELLFTVDHLSAGTTADVTFAAIVNAAAKKELTVSAYAAVTTQPGVELRSHTTTVTVAVDQEKWGDKGTIVGRVTIGDDAPVPAVRIMMDDGRYAVTDGQGYYTLRDVHSGPRALKLDPRSLKESDAVPGGLDPAQARLVRTIVPAGGIVVVDFTLTVEVIRVQTEEHLLEEDN